MVFVLMISCVFAIGFGERFVKIRSGACSICQDTSETNCPNGTLLPHTSLTTHPCIPTEQTCMEECIKHEKSVGFGINVQLGCRLNGWVGTSDFRSSYNVGDYIGTCTLNSLQHSIGSIYYTESEGEPKIIRN